jgi:hypothetical protein
VQPRHCATVCLASKSTCAALCPALCRLDGLPNMLVIHSLTALAANGLTGVVAALSIYIIAFFLFSVNKSYPITRFLLQYSTYLPRCQWASARCFALHGKNFFEKRVDKRKNVCYDNDIIKLTYQVGR